MPLFTTRIRSAGCVASRSDFTSKNIAGAVGVVGAALAGLVEIARPAGDGVADEE